MRHFVALDFHLGCYCQLATHNLSIMQFIYIDVQSCRTKLKTEMKISSFYILTFGSWCDFWMRCFYFFCIFAVGEPTGYNIEWYQNQLEF